MQHITNALQTNKEHIRKRVSVERRNGIHSLMVKFHLFEPRIITRDTKSSKLKVQRIKIEQGTNKE